jgi:hypothetical protein
VLLGLLPHHVKNAGTTQVGKERPADQKHRTESMYKDAPLCVK